MIYDPSNKILTMSQTDAEHCGFNWADFGEFLHLAGIDRDAAKEISSVHTMVISMHRGLYK